MRFILKALWRAFIYPIPYTNIHNWFGIVSVSLLSIWTCVDWYECVYSFCYVVRSPNRSVNEMSNRSASNTRKTVGVWNVSVFFPFFFFLLFVSYWIDALLISFNFVFFFFGSLFLLHFFFSVQPRCLCAVKKHQQVFFPSNIEEKLLLNDFSFSL